MTKIKYTFGDATQPQGEGRKMIAHVCNDIGAWGSGFVLALSRRWSEPEAAYRELKLEELTLGSVHIVPVEDDIVVANMIGQHNIRTQVEDGTPPIRYAALVHALEHINQICIAGNMSLHMPKIGSDRAGGNWEFISKLIEEIITVPTTVYILK